LTGYVLSTTNNTGMVLCDDGIRRLCSFKGKRIKAIQGSYNSLAAGDRVSIAPTEADRGLVIALEPRKNVFGRYNEKGRAEQAIAANIDRVVCVTSPSMPPFRPRFIDRLAVLAENAQVPFIIILNKSDLGVPDEVEERLAVYRSLGYLTCRTSIKSGEGIDEIKAMVSAGISVFAGQSGVGKSSLLNAIIPGQKRRVQNVSEKYERGKHTTTMAEAVLADKGCIIIDTPGIRRLALRNIEPTELFKYFPELPSIVEKCLLGSRCLHVSESGCAVKAAVESGIIHRDRFESYLRILEELSLPTEWKKSGLRDPGKKDRAAGSIWRSNGMRYDPLNEDEDY
jgi:ribosome biogenesis GTPase